MANEITYIDAHGYARFKDSDKLVHRWVAYTEIYLEERWDYIFPFSEYVVHHKDGNKLNNDVSNLEILEPEEHAEIHGKVEDVEVEPLIKSYGCDMEKCYVHESNLHPSTRTYGDNDDEEAWINGYAVLALTGILIYILILALKSVKPP